MGLGSILSRCGVYFDGVYRQFRIFNFHLTSNFIGTTVRPVVLLKNTRLGSHLPKVGEKSAFDTCSLTTNVFTVVTTWVGYGLFEVGLLKPVFETRTPIKYMHYIAPNISCYRKHGVS